MKSILDQIEALIADAERIDPRTPDVAMVLGGLHTARDAAQKILRPAPAPKVKPSKPAAE